MLVQAFLRNGGDVLDLIERFAIDAKWHPRYPSLCMLKYDQIDSPFSEPIVRECRGVILDQARNWNVVSRPFDKFFNFGESLAAPIDWETAVVQEKVDGSLMTLYHHDDMWHVASSGTPDASGNVNGLPITFNKLFWDTFAKGWAGRFAESYRGPDYYCVSTSDGDCISNDPRCMHQPGLLLPPNGCEDLCFMFELTTPHNRVVVQHTDYRLTLLAVRNRKTGEYQPYDNWASYYPSVECYPIRSLEQARAHLDIQNGLRTEGFVVVNKDGSRVKMKNDDYVRLHHLRDSINGSPKAMLEIVRANESTEFLAHFPEWQADYDRVKGAYEALVTELEAAYEVIRHCQIQKEFALEAVKTRCSGALFSLRGGKVKSIRHHLAEITIKSLMEILKLNDPV